MTAQRSTPVLNAYATLYAAFLYAPILLLPVFSFNDSSIVAFPLKGFTLRWYEGLFADAGLLPALRASLAVAVAVAAVSTALGLLAALGLVRMTSWMRPFLLAVITLPLLVPPLVLGVSLLTFLKTALGLELSLITIALGHVLVCLPYALLVLLARLESFDRSLEEASADLGQNALGTFRRVTVPLAMPGIVSSFLLCTVISFDEFLVAFFLSGTQPTLPIVIWGSLRFPARLPATLALGTLILAVTAAIVVFAEIYRRRDPYARNGAAA